MSAGKGKKVKQILETISMYDLEGSIDSVINFLKERKRLYIEIPAEDIRIEIDYRGDDKQFILVWERPENDKEKQERLAKEELSRQYRKAEYERLKKEFGSDTAKP